MADKICYKHLEIIKNPKNSKRGFGVSFFEVKDQDTSPFVSNQNKEKLEEYFSMLLDNLKEGEQITVYLTGIEK